MATNENEAVDYLTDRIKGAARRLHELADRVEREGLMLVTSALADGHRSYTEAGAAIAHEVAWGVANLNIESLIRAGTDADRQRPGGS